MNKNSTSDCADSDTIHPCPPSGVDVYDYEYLHLRNTYLVDTDVLADMIFEVVDGNSDNSIKILQTMRAMGFPQMTTYMDELDDYTWFVHDYYKDSCPVPSAPTDPPGTAIRYQRRRCYFWEDEGTNYVALTQTIVNILGAADNWIGSAYSGNAADVTILGNIIRVFTVILSLHTEYLNHESSDDDYDYTYHDISGVRASHN